MKNYFSDPFILQMVPENEHRPLLPLMNRGTFCRYFSINSTVRKILNSVPKTENVNIIIPGSGFDTLYFNLMNEKYTNINVYELDFKKIIEKKTKIIKNSNLKIDKNYNLIACDITDINLLKKTFENLPNKNDLTIIIFECILVYLDKETTVKIINEFKNIFKNLIVIEYDLIGANDMFGKEMVQNLKSRNIELRGFYDVPDLDSQIKRLKECDFDFVQFKNLLWVYNSMISKEERRRIDLLEMMDEFEEFNLLQTHACFGIGGKISDEKYKNILNIIKLE